MDDHTRIGIDVPGRACPAPLKLVDRLRAVEGSSALELDVERMANQRMNGVLVPHEARLNVDLLRILCRRGTVIQEDHAGEVLRHVSGGDVRLDLPVELAGQIRRAEIAVEELPSKLGLKLRLAETIEDALPREVAPFV